MWSVSLVPETFCRGAQLTEEDVVAVLICPRERFKSDAGDVPNYIAIRNRLDLVQTRMLVFRESRPLWSKHELARLIQ